MVFFDPTIVEREPQIETVAAGQYIVDIDHTVEKNKDGNVGVSLYLKIIHPKEYQNKLVFDYFNITHYKETTQKIGRLNFAKLLDCIGMGDKKLAQLKLIEGKKVKIDMSYAPQEKYPNKVERYLALTLVDENLIKDYKPDSKKTIDNKVAVDYSDIPF